MIFRQLNNAFTHQGLDGPTGSEGPAGRKGDQVSENSCRQLMCFSRGAASLLIETTPKIEWIAF